MALKTIRIGSMVDIFQYDDAAFDSAIETTAPIKAGTPIAANDVLRLSDITSLGANVVGPASATDNAVARFNGATGKIIQNSKVIINDGGDVDFESGAGLIYGEIYAYGIGATIAIGGLGKGNKVQVTAFNTTGLNNGGVTPDHGEDHIIPGSIGHFMCTVSLTVESSGGGGADHFGFSIWKNDGGVEFQNVHAHRKLAGGGGDTGSVSMSGIINCAAADTIELWCWNEDSTDNLVVDDATLTLMKLGRG